MTSPLLLLVVQDLMPSRLPLGPDMDVCLRNYGYCNYLSDKHCSIFYDEVSTLGVFFEIKSRYARGSGRGLGTQSLPFILLSSTHSTLIFNQRVVKICKYLPNDIFLPTGLETYVEMPVT